MKNSLYHSIPFGKVDIRRKDLPDGSICLTSAVPLEPYPSRATERLVHWAEKKPDHCFLAQKKQVGQWEKLTYRETLDAVLRIAQALIDKQIDATRPIAILSENSIEHALIGLAAMHVGLPHSPISQAYSLRSNDFKRLRQCLDQLKPGLIFVQNLDLYKKALEAVSIPAEIVAVNLGSSHGFHVCPFAELLKSAPTEAVANAYEGVGLNTIAKILFTSGSTGNPKGVINTHGNLTSNWQQLSQVYPFLMDGLTTIDWLPWSHTYGGNHNLGVTLYNGGTFYIDEGNPTPGGIGTSIQNLKEVAPEVYFNVPRGFEELIPFLRSDQQLRENFFSHLKMLFYGGASLSQTAWEALETLSVEATGKKVIIGVGLGCTESSPGALFKQQEEGFAGMVGVPASGLSLKLVHTGTKMEACFKGPNISPGYWSNPELSELAFDSEGYFKTGDALRFADASNSNAGMVYDGRLTEDFKLDSGTWVNVGQLRARLVASSNGLIQDAVITGENRPYVGAIVFPQLKFLKKLTGKDDFEAILSDERSIYALSEVLRNLANEAGASSSTVIKRAVFAAFKPSMDKGEITDKGTINQRAVREHHQELISKLYSAEVNQQIPDISPKQHMVK